MPILLRWRGQYGTSDENRPATKTITLTVQSETTADWEATGDERWTVPVNLEIAKLSKFGDFPASYQLGYGFFPAHPDIGPTWKVRGAVIILLPRQKK